MINFSTSKSNNFPFIYFLIPAMAGSLFWLVSSNYFVLQPDLMSLSISVDLIITIPLIYFLIIRKRKVSKLTIIPVTVAAMIFGFFILPNDQHQYLNMFYHYVFPFIELAIIGTIGFKAFKGIKAIRRQGKENPDMLTVIRNTSKSMVSNKKAGAIISTEMAFIYYALLSYFQPKNKVNDINSFSYHMENGMTGLVAILIFILLAETFILHILLVKWSVVAAWILTGISLYSLIFLIGQWNATKKRPITISNNALNVRFGIFGDLDIPWANIKDIRYSSNDVEEEDSHVLTFLSGHNVIISLKEPLTMTGMYGMDKSVSTIAFFIDDRKKFAATVQELMANDL